VTGQVPYHGVSNDYKIWQESTLRGPLKFALKDNKSLHALLDREPDLKEFLEACLVIDFSQRPRASQLLEFAFLN
jgi:serine/threonine protein kinase